MFAKRMIPCLDVSRGWAAKGANVLNVVWLAIVVGLIVPPAVLADQNGGVKSQPTGKAADAMAVRRATARQLIVAAIKEAQRISPPYDRSLAFDSIGQAQVAIGDVAGAKESASEIAKIRASAGKIADAREHLSMMDFMKDSLYECIVAVEARAGAIAAAKADMEKIDKRYPKAASRRPIVTAQLKAGDVPGALATAEQLVYRGEDRENPDELALSRAEAYHEIAAAQIKAGEKVRAIRTLEAAGKAAAMMPNVGVCLEIATAQVKAGDAAGAVKTVAIAMEAARLMQYSKSQPAAYREVFEARVMAGDLAGAKAEATKMTEQFNRQPLWRDAYKGIITGQAKTGDFAGAKATVAEISRENTAGTRYLKASAYSEIASFQAAAGDIAGAKATAAEIDSEQREWAYRGIARAQAAAGDMAGARHTLDLADTLATKRVGSARPQALVDIVEDRVRARDFVGAKATAVKINDPTSCADILLEIGRAQAKAGDVGAARDTVESARKVAEQSSADYRTIAYLAIAKAQAVLGEIAAARKTLELAKKAAGQLADKYRWAHQRLAEAQATFGELAAAKATASQIEDKCDQGRAYEAIIATQAMAGDAAGAIDYSDSLTADPVRRSLQLAAVATEMCSPPEEPEEP